MGQAPNHLVVPTGSGVTALSIYLGFKQLMELGIVDSIPAIHIVQTTTCPTIALMMRYIHGGEGREHGLVVGLSYCDNPLADYIARILSRVNSYGVIVSLNEIYDSTIELAKLEGLFVEPAAGAAIAGLKLLVEQGVIDSNENVVVLLTGTGLKAFDVFTQYRRHPRKYLIPSTKLQILRILYEHGEIHGYHIWKTFLSKITPQAVYQHLSELESRGLITSIVKSRRKVYKLTEKGRKVAEILKQLKELY